MATRQMVQVNFRLESEIKAWLEQKSKDDERSQGWLIGKLLKDAMQNDQQIKQA